ncbi:MAG: hypothetical protein ACOC0Q_06330 [Wenzhouxiangella sp.]
MNCIQRGLILLAAAAAMADAAGQLRSNAMVDTTWRGHLNWNGSGKILKDSDCYFLDRDYIMVGLGDGVTLRLVYRAAQSGVMASVDWQQPVLVELQVAEGRSDGAYYRAEPPPADASDITTEGNTSFGQTRLNAINEAARRANPEGVVAEFEFRCS